MAIVNVVLKITVGPDSRLPREFKKHTRISSHCTVQLPTEMNWKEVVVLTEKELIIIWIQLQKHRGKVLKSD